MKNIVKNFILTIIFIFILATTVQAMSINIETDPSELKVDEEVTVKVILDESVVTSDFKLKYNKDSFKFVSADTEYLNTKDYANYGYVTSVYANTEGESTKEFEFKFKAIEQIENAIFEIEEINCTTEESKAYDDSNLDQNYKSEEVKVIVNTKPDDNNTPTNPENPNGDDNSEKDEEKTNTIKGEDTTLANGILPFAGGNTIIIISIVVLIILAFVFKKKSKYLTKILPIFIAGIIITNIANMNNSYAYTQTIKIFKLDNQTDNVNIYSILLNSIDVEKKVTASELKDILKSINEIKTNDDKDIQDNDLVGTGCTMKLSDESESKVLLYGDANGDGKINSNDTYMMIQHMLEKDELTGLYAKAVNLSNKDDQSDEKIDEEDITKHINFILGVLEDDFIEELPQEAKDLSQYIDINFDNAEDEKLQAEDECNFSIVLGEQTPKAHAEITKIIGEEKSTILNQDLIETQNYKVNVENNVEYEITVSISDDNNNVIHNITGKINMIPYFDTEEGAEEKNTLEETAANQIENLEQELENIINDIEEEHYNYVQQKEQEKDKKTQEYDEAIMRIEDDARTRKNTANSNCEFTIKEIQFKLEQGLISQTKAEEMQIDAIQAKDQEIQNIEQERKLALQSLEESYVNNMRLINEELEIKAQEFEDEKEKIQLEISAQKEGILSGLSEQLQEKEKIIVVQKVK